MVPKSRKEPYGLDQKTAALRGGDSGPLLVPGQSAQSLLVQAVVGTRNDLARMPKKKEPLTSEQIGVLRAWIDQGANWPDETSTVSGKDWHKHWAFKAPVRPGIPELVPDVGSETRLIHSCWIGCSGSIFGHHPKRIGLRCCGAPVWT
jgi:hypothetical protein